MDFEGSQYYNINRILMICVGLWPFERTIYSKLINIFIFLLLSTAIFIQVKALLDEIKKDWNSLKNTEELRIIHEYSKTIKGITICFIIIIVPLQLVFFLSIFGNDILDILIPLNHTRLRTVPIVIDYFGDQQKFFYIFGMHLNLIISFGGLGIIATETTSMAIMQHLCGLLKIVR
ncbi:uncharacterized protein LOC133667496 [Apis cerana]|uniref:uncharacterized protein LOC133667496 n=1 Tax=Apis cerana TaxID=7461 RepID=UPI002B223091|nr:uncharacterized protein LOC133667496 [Apis cerana]